MPTGLNSLSSSGTISTASVSTQIPQLDQNGDLLEDTKSECNSTEKEMAAIKNNRNGKVRNCMSHFFLLQNMTIRVIPNERRMNII